MLKTPSDSGYMRQMRETRCVIGRPATATTGVQPDRARSPPELSTEILEKPLLAPAAARGNPQIDFQAEKAARAGLAVA